MLEKARKQLAEALSIEAIMPTTFCGLVARAEKRLEKLEAIEAKRLEKLEAIEAKRLEKLQAKSLDDKAKVIKRIKRQVLRLEKRPEQELHIWLAVCKESYEVYGQYVDEALDELFEESPSDFITGLYIELLK
jgi:beta-phosphoglucomutase-like phosphatase (HAD superfamily)